MCEILLFGGTSEGRILAEFLSAREIPATVCVATGYGESVMDVRPPVRVRVGRLDAGDMEKLIGEISPALVVDATHPYADAVTRNIREACRNRETPYLRVHRESDEEEGCRYFDTLDEAIDWINGQEGVVFSSLGAKAAADLCRIERFQERVYLRLLPYPDGISSCIDLGYPMAHLLGMQGPFSRSFNEAMFRETGASILLTKEAGSYGGFQDKVLAAQACGMEVAVIARPADPDGMTLEQVKERILEVAT